MHGYVHKLFNFERGPSNTQSKQMKILEGNLCDGNFQEKQMMGC